MRFLENEILHLIKNGESESVEFKKSTSSLREAIQSICAFANHRGYVIFGVEDSGSIIGQQVTDDTIKNISNAIKLNTDPKLYASIEKMDLEGKACLLVSIDESPLKPHLAYGRPYLRAGTTNQKIDRDHYEYLIQQRYNGYGFDHWIQNGATLKDIDSDSLYEFLATANAIRNLNENMLLPPEEILKKIQNDRYFQERMRISKG